MADIINLCPQCKKPFSKTGGKSGLIGYCDVHERWYPRIENNEARTEAAQENKKAEEEKKRRHIEEEKKREQAKKERERRQRNAFLTKVGAGVAAVAIIGLVVYQKTVVPANNYKKAAAALETADYQSGFDYYKALGKYKDSGVLADLCKACLAIESGDPQTAVTVLQTISEDGRMTDQIKEQAAAMLTNWSDEGVSPEMALEVLTAANELEMGDALASHLTELLTQWKKLEIRPDHTLSLIKLDQALGLELADVDLTATWDEAVMAAANRMDTLSKSALIDWNDDGQSEVLGWNSEGILKVYAYNDSLKEAWQDDTQMVPGTMTFRTITEESGQEDTQIYLTSSAKTDVGFYLVQKEKLEKQQVLHNLSGIEEVDQWLALGMNLVGSIKRDAVYMLDMDHANEQAEFVDVAWQKDNYPAPDSAASAVVRYLETVYYGLAEEQALLVKESESSSLPLGEMIDWADVPVPNDVTAIGVAPYYIGDNELLAEVTYVSDHKEICLYARCIKDNGWKVAGFMKSYRTEGTGERGDANDVITPINGATEDVMVDENDSRMYRMLLPDAAQVTLKWKAGKENRNEQFYNVRIFAADDLKTPILSYGLGLSTTMQISDPLFLNGGLYYVSVTPVKYDGAGYSISFSSETVQNGEHESNNTASTANEIAVNEVYTGSLFNPSDADNYRFTLDETSRVVVSFKAKANDGKKSRFAVSVNDAKGASVYTSGAMTGLDSELELPVVYLKNGEYTVCVEHAEEWDGQAYQLNVMAEPAENTEAESNDLLDQATPILLNTETTGSFALESDVDYYTFTLDSAVQYQAVMDFVPNGSADLLYQLTLMDGSQHVYQALGIPGNANNMSAAPILLQAGTYFLKVENPEFDTQEYSLCINTQSSDHAENEPNDTIEAATAIELNEAYSGSISKADDVDCYKISLEETTGVEVSFKSAVNGEKNSRYVLSLTDLEGQALTDPAEMTGKEAEAHIQTVYLKAGEYIVTVAKGKKHDPQAYELTVNTVSGGNCEAEANNRPEEATSILPGVDTKGVFSYQGDVDCYTFTLENDAVYQSVAEFALCEGGKIYQLTLTDQAGQIRQKVKIGSKENGKANLPVALKAGTYFLKVENSENNHSDYTIRVNAMNVDNAEAEPNDALAQAMPVSLGSSVTGVISAKEDNDLYLLHLDQQTEVKVGLSFGKTNVDGTLFRLQVESQGKSVWATDIPGAQTSYSQQISFPAGDYYLRITQPGSAITYYTLTLE